MSVSSVLLGVHIAAGAIGLGLGPVAMRLPKRRGAHTNVGETYHWVYAIMAGTAVVIAVMNWSESWFFVPIAGASYALALLGYLAAKRRPRGRRWLVPHVIGQAGSYIAMVSAVLTVNWETITGRAGDSPLDIVLPNLVPSLVGIPIIAWLVIQIRKGRRPKRRRRTAAPTV